MNGFTLIEFLVATVILAVGLLGLLQCINLAMEKNLDNMYRTEAVLLIDERLMKKRTIAFEALSTTIANPDKISIHRATRGVYRNYSVQEIVSQVTPHSKQIEINISWRTKNGRSSHSASSLVSNF
jgi:type IV pilus assembly protein PilV